jgi:hypothetical protein
MVVAPCGVWWLALRVQRCTLKRAHCLALLPALLVLLGVLVGAVARVAVLLLRLHGVPLVVCGDYSVYCVIRYTCACPLSVKLATRTLLLLPCKLLQMLVACTVLTPIACSTSETK